MISIIAAIGKNRELGKNNGLLWHISEDFKRFKDVTSGHIVIMGRKTYESLPEKFRPLPNRVNVVITRNKNSVEGLINQAPTTIFCDSLEQAIENSQQVIRNKKLPNEIFIIGGASVYAQGIKYADKLYLTLVDKVYPEADAFFPEYGKFGKVSIVGEGEEGGLRYKFIELVK